MWKKLISQDGQWLILEHRTWTKNGPAVDKIFVSVNDSDYEQALAFCEEKGL
jgi:hypothetical protein